MDYDRDYFNDIIIKNDDTKHKYTTPSQKRIKKAKDFFQKSLHKLTTKQILDIFKAMQKAEILSIPFTKKKDSVLMFELQNNRGASLTNMEKLKSYLAYQIYTYCGDEAENKLSEITDIFKEIYRVIKDINAKEDSILLWFNISRSRFGFNYREEKQKDRDTSYKRELKYKLSKDDKNTEREVERSNDEKIVWIENYIKELKNAFFDFKDFENSTIYAKFLQILDVWEAYPFILKAYRLFREDEKSLEIIFKSLEIMAFRDKLVKTRADLASRLNEVLKFESIESLIDGLKELCSGEEGEWWKYWRDEAVQNALVRIYIENKNILPYLFMRYENYLRSRKTTTKGQPFRLSDIPNPQREHIAPQTEKDEKVASGYDEYDNEFKEFYLHCIGNLALISQPQNGYNGNKPFAEKLESYKEQGLLRQLTEIENFASKDDNGRWKWDKEAINKRHKELEKFVLETWSFK